MNLKALLLTLIVLVPGVSFAQQAPTLGLGEWLTVSSNLDAGYRRTQLFLPEYDTLVLNTDTRIELWLPPFRRSFSWGPYLRVAAITSSREQLWENAWLALPGVGVQAFPFSLDPLRDSPAARVFGPLRVFAEYNAVNYEGNAPATAPDKQTRVGLDYWRAIHVNDRQRPWWAETWHGVTRQSSNEFASDYDTWVLADVARVGIRKPGPSLLSAFSGYGAVESTSTRNAEYFWENRLLLGGGVRVTPSFSDADDAAWLTRLVFYAEYLRVAAYYRGAADDFTPRFDFRVGVGASLGDWYK